MTRKLMPLKVTPEMYRAGGKIIQEWIDKGNGGWWQNCAIKVYKAMLSAAPSQETVEELLAKVPEGWHVQIRMPWADGVKVELIFPRPGVVGHTANVFEYSEGRDAVLIGHGKTLAAALKSALERGK